MAQYCVAGDAIPLPKDNLKYAIEQEYNVSIDVYTVPLESTLLRGMFERYEGGSKIYLDGALSSAWTRYVFAKEVSHHLIANASFQTDDPYEMISAVLLDEKDIDGTGVAPLDVQSESITKYAAIEILFPYEMRVELKKQIESGEKTSYEIATYIDIPEHLVQFALSDAYMNFSASVWAEIN